MRMLALLISKMRSLEGASFENANLEGASFKAANLENACLVGANLEDVNFINANLANVNLSSANFCDALLMGANLEGADFTDVKNLTVEQIKTAKNWDKGKYDPEFGELLGLLQEVA